MQVLALLAVVITELNACKDLWKRELPVMANLTKRSATSDYTGYWSSRVVPYIISSAFCKCIGEKESLGRTL